jgi:uncharacterized protein (DUF305 family)
MRRSSPRTLAALLLSAVALAGCRTGAREPAAGGAPPAPAATPTQPAAAAGTGSAGGAAPAGARPRHTAADVRFMQRMIGHHGQALTMTSLVPTRSRREDLNRLAERIAVSQRDEMAMMRRWLVARGEAAPDTGGHQAHHGAHHGAGGHDASMPGMLTEQELARLAGASGAAFDRLFLELMIRHHEGAVAMVAELHASPGAAQEAEVFRFAADVDADQRAEIRRMRALLRALADESPRR